MSEKEMFYKHNYTGNYLSGVADKLEEFQGRTIWKFKKGVIYTATIPSTRPTALPYLVTSNLIALKSEISSAIEYCKYMAGRCPQCKRLYD